MKNTIYYIGALVVLSIVILQCEKESGEETQVNHVQTVLGGCNDQSFDEIKLPRYEQNDTLQFYVRNDTLNVFVGINYICCAPFATGFEQSADTLLFKITDTCPAPYETCYCRCMCYYTFNFLFDSFAEKEYYFKIIVNDPRQDEPYVFREGFVNLSYKQAGAFTPGLKLTRKRSISQLIQLEPYIGQSYPFYLEEGHPYLPFLTIGFRIVLEKKY